jgi:hypothetical protein
MPMSSTPEFKEFYISAKDKNYFKAKAKAKAKARAMGKRLS